MPDPELQTMRRRIAAAALRDEVGSIYRLSPPARHHDIIQHMHKAGLSPIAIARSEQGFVLEDGRFVRRRLALHIAQEAGQLIREPTAPHGGLFSEDLW